MPKKKQLKSATFCVTFMVVVDAEVADPHNLTDAESSDITTDARYTMEGGDWEPGDIEVLSVAEDN